MPISSILSDFERKKQGEEIKRFLRYISISKYNVSVTDLVFTEMRPFSVIFNLFTSLQVGVLASALKAL